MYYDEFNEDLYMADWHETLEFDSFGKLVKNTAIIKYDSDKDNEKTAYKRVELIPNKDIFIKCDRCEKAGKSSIVGKLDVFTDLLYIREHCKGESISVGDIYVSMISFKCNCFIFRNKHRKDFSFKVISVENINITDDDFDSMKGNN